MKVKTYRASSMKLALEDIKQELGPDAFILGGRQVKGRKLLGFKGKSYFEVTAAVDHPRRRVDGANRRPTDPDEVQDRVQLSPAATRRRQKSAQQSEPRATGALPSFNPEGSGGIPELLDEIRDVKSMVAKLSAGRGSVASSVPQRSRSFDQALLSEAYDKLLACGVEESLAYEVLASVSQPGGTKPMDKATLDQRVLNSLSHRIPLVSGDDGAVSPSRILALLGPTGVGKTTTLAKLAARATLEQRRRVGLITADTFRIAAIDQLKTYADIIGIPVRVVESETQMASAIQEFSDKDLILVDTAGRGPQEPERSEDLASYLQRSGFISKTLLLSASTRSADLVECVDRFQRFGPDSVIFTKLDETSHYGSLISEVARGGLPLSYVTTGQNVPRDILRPNPIRLVNLALQGGRAGWADFLSHQVQGNSYPN